MTNLLLAGATGLVGSEALKLLLADDRVVRVVAPTRRPLPPHQKLFNPITTIAELPRDADWWAVDGAISALGTTRAKTPSDAEYRAIDHDYPLAIATLVRERGATSFALTSSMGANARSRFTYTRTKGELEDAIGGLGFPSLTIARPGFIGGSRSEHRSMERAINAFLSIVAPILPASARTNPASTIAAMLVDSAIRGCVRRWRSITRPGRSSPSTSRISITSSPSGSCASPTTTSSRGQGPRCPAPGERVNGRAHPADFGIARVTPSATREDEPRAGPPTDPDPGSPVGLLIHSVGGACGGRLHLPVHGGQRIARQDGSNLLLVGIPPTEGAMSRGLSRDRERVTFLANDGGTHDGPLIVAANTAVFELQQRLMEAACGVSPLPLRSQFEISDRKIRSLAERVVLLEDNAPASFVVREMMWLALARTVGSVFGGLRHRQSDGWLNPGALQRTVELVESHIGEDLPVARLAKAAGLSSSAFLRAFRGSTGITPGEFALRRRIALGAELLLTTNAPVSAIARRAGFKSSNHFATTFAVRCGMPPSTFRRRHLPT